MALSAIMIGSIIGQAKPTCAQSNPEALKVRFYGFVRSNNGTPIDDAVIYLFGQDSFSSIKGTRSNSSGYYFLEAVINESPVSLHVVSRNSTRIVNFMPATVEVSVEQNLTKQVNFTLGPAATVILRGRLTALESSESMRRYTYEVVDPINGSVLKDGGYKLVYGSERGKINRLHIKTNY